MNNTKKEISLNSQTIFHNFDFFEKPYETFQAIQCLGNIHKINIFGGIWYIGGYDEIVKYINHPSLSHNVNNYFMGMYTQEEQNKLLPFTKKFGLWLSHFDGDYHAKYKQLFIKAMHGSISNLEMTIDNTVDSLFKNVKNKTNFDLLKDIAYPLPVKIVLNMLKIPSQYENLALETANNMATLFGSTKKNMALAKETQRTYLEMEKVISSIVNRRRNNSENTDFISLLIKLSNKEFPLTDEEISAQIMMMLFAGHETTRNLIANGIYRLLMNPQQMKILRNDMNLLKGFLEETLRFDSPVQLTMRLAIEDTVILGKKIKKGQLVMFSYGSANFDVKKYTNPNKFLITRNESEALSFGVGAHVCPGAALAGMQFKSVIKKLFNEFSTISLDESKKYKWLENASFRGLEHLIIKVKHV